MVIIIINSLIATVAMFAAISFVAHLLGWDEEDE